MSEPFCSQSGGCASIGPLTYSCYHVTVVGFVRIALKVVMQNGRDLVDIILVYSPWFNNYSMENWVLPSSRNVICNCLSYVKRGIITFNF